MKRALFAVCCLAAVAHADPYADGRKLLKQRKYDDAIAKLEEAARTDARPEIHYHLAIAYELAGDRAKAIQHYRLVAEAKSKYTADAERLAVKIEAQVAGEQTIARQRAEAEQEAQQRSQRLVEAETHLTTAKARVAALEAEVTARTTTRDAAVASAADGKLALARAQAQLDRWRKHALAAPSGRGRGFRMLGLVFGMGGTALLAASAWYANDSRSIEDTLAGLQTCGGGEPMPVCTWSDRFTPLTDRGERNNGYIQIAAPAGGVALLLGATLFIHGERVVMPARPADELERRP